MIDVSFEYMVNGERIMPEYLTSTSLDYVFGLNEYAITGSFNQDEEISDIQIIIKGEDDLGSFVKLITPYAISQPQWVQSPTEEFMERLWAFKRINYLLGDQIDCTEGKSCL